MIRHAQLVAFTKIPNGGKAMRGSCEDSAIGKVFLADGWHTIRPGSFRCGSFTVKGTEDQLSLELADAVWWEEDGDDLVVVPRSAILALKRRACESRGES
jgi:hypothetical protein